MTKSMAWYAERYIDKFGFKIVPVDPGKKFPTTDDWGNNLLEDSESAKRFYSNNTNWNAGISLGASGFCSLDIDCLASFSVILEEFGVPLTELDSFPAIQGASKGKRLLFKVPEGMALPYTKLNWPTKDNEKKKYTVFELRAATDGKQRQDILPPSIHPDTKQPYKWLSQPVTPWPTPPDWLIAIWTAWDSFKPQMQDACPWVTVEPRRPPPERKQTTQQQGGAQVIEAYIEAHPLTDTLERYGYTRKGKKRWLSPHTSTNLPGVILFPDESAAWIHHASDPLCSDDTGQPVNSFDLFKYYEHDGDIKAAVKAAADELGIKQKRKTTQTANEAKQQDEPTDKPPANKPYSPFKALGYNGNHYYYLPRGTEQVKQIKAGSHASPTELMSMAPIEWWEMAYPKEKGGADWLAAANDAMRRCEQLGIYSQDRERGRGAWFDAGRSVLHLGNKLLVDGVPVEISDLDTAYIYTRQSPLELGADAKPASNEDAKLIASLFDQLNWAKPVHAHLLAGWCVLAPICGGLTWRPHVWLTAQRGAGKTWIQDHIIGPMLGPSALMVQGGTTEAGIRQKLKQDARPIVFDEAESEDVKSQSRMKMVLELARGSSSDTLAEIAKGTADGAGSAFRMRSMFLLGSINVSLSQAADESRFSVVTLVKPESTTAERERFESFCKHVDNTLTDKAAASLRARSYRLLPVIRRNASIFASAAAEKLGSQRIGDQVGALLAGSFSLYRDCEINIDEARLWIDGFDFSESQDAEQVSDEENCINRMLQTQVRFDSDRGHIQRSIGELISCVSGCEVINGITQSEANCILSRYGFRYESGYVLISNNHAELMKMLRESPWGSGWRRILLRIDGAEPGAAAKKFAGSVSRYTKIPIDFFK